MVLCIYYYFILFHLYRRSILQNMIINNHKKQPTVLPIINLINKHNILQILKDGYVNKIEHDIKFKDIRNEILKVNPTIISDDFFDYINIRIKLFYLF